MLSLPDDWDYSMNGLVAVNKENISAIRTALHELEENNYLKRIRQQKENRKFVYEYIIYEEPPHIDFLHTVNPYTENHTQINTNIQNTNSKDKYDKQKFPLIKELINRNFIDKDDLDILKYYDLLNELLEEFPPIYLTPWPVYDEAKLEDDVKEIGVQVNGKVRATIFVQKEDTEESIKEKALANDNILRHTEGKTIVKVIVIKDRIVNIVVK